MSTIQISRRRLLGRLATASLKASAARPNIVLIVADDLGWRDVSMNGCADIRTPNIDSIARQGVRFTQFYSNAPECTPARCALLTGRYQQRVGGLECAIGSNNTGRYDEAEWLQKRGQLGLPSSELTMGRIFKDAGYDTALIGKWHLGYEKKHWPDRHGFDHVFTMLSGSADYYTHQELNEGEGKSFMYDNGSKVEPRGYMTDLFTDRAVTWLKKRERPFLLYLPYTAPHLPVQAPEDFNPQTGTAPYKDKDRRAYGRVVERMDHGIGTVLQRLEAIGVAASTVVIFISDNGGAATADNGPLRGRKGSIYEGGIRVPCCVRWPASLPPDSVIDQVGLTMDLLPTLIHAAGLPKPASRRQDGIDLLPVMQGKAPTVSRTVFWRFKRAQFRRKAVRDQDWKYTNDSGEEALFHLGRDPVESVNLLETEPVRARRLKAKLAAWEEDVQAPRLRGFQPG